MTLVQKDMKKLIAYSSVSHLGFVMLGMFALNPLGLEGSVLQMVNHGLSTGGLFLIVGHRLRAAAHQGDRAVRRARPRDAGLRHLHPDHLPGLDGPAAPERVHRRVHDPAGAFAANRVWAYWAVSGIVVLGAAYLLWLYQRVFWGKVTNEDNRHLVDLNRRELATLVPLVVLCFWIGIYPKPFLDFLHTPAKDGPGAGRACPTRSSSGWASPRRRRGRRCPHYNLSTGNGGFGVTPHAGGYGEGASLGTQGTSRPLAGPRGSPASDTLP